MDDSDLTQEELEKIVQYQEVTGIENLTAAREELIQSNWDVEIAVQNHLSNQDSPQHATNNQHTSSNSFINISRSSTQEENRIIGNNQRSWFFGRLLWTIPVQVFYRIFRWCYYLLSLPMRIFIPFPRRLVDPLGDIISFINEYESNYGMQHPVFFKGSYSQALNQAKTELKFLLVYLHCRDNQDTPNFCSNVLSDTKVIDYINSTVIFWACSVTSGEGYRVSQALRENSYPFLAVIVLKENKMTVVGRLEGHQNPDGLIKQLKTFIRDSEAYLVVARVDRQERELTAALRQEQDVAYLESLRADQEKARKRLEKQEALSKQEEQEKEDEKCIIQARENIRKLKYDWADRIPEEPGENENDVIHIVVKLPQGTRLNRRFYATQSLAGLYYYIFCHPDSPDKFQVTTNFPRKPVPCEPTEQTPEPQSFKDFGMPQRCMLFVIDLDA